MSGNWCFRQLDAGLGSPLYNLHLAVQFTSTYAFIWIWDNGRGYVQSYAVGRSNLAVWYKFNGSWYKYDSATTQIGPTTISINTQGCGAEYLCTLGMLDANRRLPNGSTVPQMLWKLAWGAS